MLKWEDFTPEGQQKIKVLAGIVIVILLFLAGGVAMQIYGCVTGGGSGRGGDSQPIDCRVEGNCSDPLENPRDNPSSRAGR